MFAAGGEPANDAERLGESSHFDIDLVFDSIMDPDSAPFAQHAFAVRVVHVGHRAIFSGERADFVERRGVAVHREDAVGDDEPAPRVGSLAQQVFQLTHVIVRVDVARRLRQSHAINNRAVVQLVGEKVVALAHQLRNQPGVDGEASLVVDGGVTALELGDALLQPDMQVHVACNRPHAARASTVAADSRNGGLLQPRVVAQVQVVVRAEHQPLAAANLAAGR